MISVDEISRQVADLCPEDHLKAFLKRDTRPDGRSLEEFRPIIIAPNVLNRLVVLFWFWVWDQPFLVCGCLVPTVILSCDSSCLVRLGATKVMCGIKAELVKPEADSPKSGMVSVNFEFSSVSSSNQRSGPPTEKAQSISIFVNNILKGILDLTEIGIKGQPRTANPIPVVIFHIQRMNWHGRFLLIFIVWKTMEIQMTQHFCQR